MQTTYKLFDELAVWHMEARLEWCNNYKILIWFCHFCDEQHLVTLEKVRRSESKVEIYRTPIIGSAAIKRMSGL